MKKTLLLIIFFITIVVVSLVYFLKPQISIQKQSQCLINELTFYYSDQCHWCQQVKDEGTLEKLEQLGLKISKINIAIGPVRHKFEAVPVFVIADQVLTGYKTLDDLKELLGCPK